MGTAAQFAAEIDHEFEMAMDLWRQIIENVALRALEMVVARTPVLTGKARANWFVQIGGAGVEITTEVDKTGAVTIARGASVIGTYKQQIGFPVITMYNNQPYIGRLEDGYSNKSPEGMVAVTIAELQAEI